MAPVANRRTIAFDRLDFVDRNRLRVASSAPSRPRSVARVPVLIVDELRVLLEDRCSTATGCMLQLEHRVRIEQVILAVAAPLILTAPVQVGRSHAAASGSAWLCRFRTSSAITSRPTPPMRDAVHVKYRSTNSCVRVRRPRRSGRRNSSAASRCPSSTSPSGCPC